MNYEENKGSSIIRQTVIWDIHYLRIKANSRRGSCIGINGDEINISSKDIVEDVK